MIPDLGIIFLAAGSSSRFGSENKLLEKYDNIPLFIHSIQKLSPVCASSNIVIVCSKNNLEAFKSIIEKYLPKKEFSFVIGGKERFNSVHNGLKILNGKVKYVAIHDTARPFANAELLKKCYNTSITYGTGIAAKRISDTVKRTDKDNKVIKTINRTNLWAIETPQVFKTSEIYNAYEKIISENAFITDDAGAMEYIGKAVYLVDNPYLNKKITYKTDL